MKKPLSLILAINLVAAGYVSAQQVDEGLALPDWEQQEVRILPLGGGLLPQDSLTDDRQPSAETAESGEHVPVAPPVTVEEDLVELDDDFFHQHEAPVVRDVIFDPGMLMPEDQLAVLRPLLTQQTRISAKLVILDGHQKLPAKVDFAQLGAAEASSGLSCMVVYAMGQPWRVRMFMSNPVTQAVPAEALNQFAQACIREALKTNEPFEQLQRFAAQMSVRLTWLERAYPLPAPEELTEANSTVTLAMPEVTAASEMVETPLLDRIWHQVKPWVWKATAAVLAMLTMLMILRWIWRRMRRRNRAVVWLLPDPNVAPRLGGKYCGGGGVSVRY